ncbi:MAG: M43 family zinc metalloprotease [Chitinophagales bacterium]
MKRITLLFALGLATLLAGAQQQWCGTMERLQKQIAANPAMQADYNNFLNFLQQSNAQNNRAVNEDIIYIPVVFHIIHNGDAEGTGENISDAQVLSQIDALNRDYNGLDPDVVNVPSAFASLVATPHFHFCLAKFDPNGNPTTGILREQFSFATWNTDSLIDNYLKPATIWDHTRYLNIWSCRFGGTLTSDGVLAYSSFPGFGSANQDGIVSRYNCIGTTGSILQGYESGKTITHEAGHFFGLLHPWGSNGGCTTGWGGSDFVNDTPLQDQANFGCPTFPHVSCNASAPNGDMFMNYMDYTDDACRNMFSAGQVSNILNTINGTRQSLKNATTQCFYNLDLALVKIQLPVDTICSLNFKPLIRIKNEGLTAITSFKVYFKIDAEPIQIYNWSGNINSQEEIQLLLPQLGTIDGDHSLSVTIGNMNGLSADDNSLNDDGSVNFYAYDGGTSAALPLSEGFEGNFPQTNWTLLNSNNDATWDQAYYGAYGLSNTSAAIDNFSYASNPNKRKDALITDAYDLSSATYPELKFDVAYARRDATRSDSLNVYYSLDCGSNWTKVWNQWGSELATAADATVKFIPQATEWKTVNVSIPAAAGQSKVSLKFENVTGWGNVLYLDNINLDNNAALAINEVAKVKVQLLPNPAKDNVTLQLPANHNFTKLVIYNALGEAVMQTNISSNRLNINLAQLSTGLYFIHLQGNNAQQTERLLISK